VRRLAADGHEPDRSGSVCGLLFVVVAECWPDKPDLVAIDGKTSRRSHDRKRGQKALHLVSAFATTRRLVLGQQATDEKSNEITAIPALVERINLAGAWSPSMPWDAIRTSLRASSMPKPTTFWP